MFTTLTVLCCMQDGVKLCFLITVVDSLASYVQLLYFNMYKILHLWWNVRTTMFHLKKKYQKSPLHADITNSTSNCSSSCGQQLWVLARAGYSTAIHLACTVNVDILVEVMVIWRFQFYLRASSEILKVS